MSKSILDVLSGIVNTAGAVYVSTGRKVVTLQECSNSVQAQFVRDRMNELLKSEGETTGDEGSPQS